MAAWLLMGAVKQILISQCVRTVNDQCWWQLGCNSLAMATSLPMQTVILMHYKTTRKCWRDVPLKHADTAPINNILTFLQAYQLCDDSNELGWTHHNVWFTCSYCFPRKTWCWPLLKVIRQHVIWNLRANNWSDEYSKIWQTWHALRSQTAGQLCLLMLLSPFKSFQHMVQIKYVRVIRSFKNKQKSHVFENAGLIKNSEKFLLTCTLFLYDSAKRFSLIQQLF